MIEHRSLAARETLFGAWEANWIADNDARDVTLPGSSGPTLGFLMYPQADAFKYSIRSRQITL
jgi:hypothetical protein